MARYDIRGKRILSYEEKTYVCDLGFFHIKKNRVKDEYNYIVGDVTIANLKAHQEELRVAECFVAAYPID